MHSSNLVHFLHPDRRDKGTMCKFWMAVWFCYAHIPWVFACIICTAYMLLYMYEYTGHRSGYKQQCGIIPHPLLPIVPDPTTHPVENLSW